MRANGDLPEKTAQRISPTVDRESRGQQQACNIMKTEKQTKHHPPCPTSRPRRVLASALLSSLCAWGFASPAQAADYTCEPDSMEIVSTSGVSTAYEGDHRARFADGTTFRGGVETLELEFYDKKGAVVARLSTGHSSDGDYGFIHGTFTIAGVTSEGTYHGLASEGLTEFQTDSDLSKQEFSDHLLELADEIDSCNIDVAASCGLGVGIAVGTCGLSIAALSNPATTAALNFLGGGLCFAAAADAIDRCSE